MRIFIPLAISFSILASSAACFGRTGDSTPVPPMAQPAITLMFEETSVAAGQPATLIWKSSNIFSSCVAGGAWADAQQTSGSLSVVQVTPGKYTYNLTCDGKYGKGSASASLTVTPAPAQVTVPAPGPPAPCKSDCYFVDAKQGSDQNNGTSPATAFRTLQKAADTIGPGATVIVASGTYTDAVNSPLVLKKSGTPDKWIRFIAGSGQHPVIRIPNSNSASFGILIRASYIAIDGFEVIGQNQSITLAQAKAGGNRALFNEVCIGIMGASAPAVPHDISIRNSIVHECSEAGIGLAVGDAVTIAYNTVYNNCWYSVYNSSGISLYHQVDVAGSTVTNGYKNFIVGNRAWNNYDTIPFISSKPPGITDGNAIIVDDNRHTQAALSSNDPQGVPYTGRTYVANNVVYGNGGRGVHTYSSAHVDVVNNTAYNDLLTDSQYMSMEIDAASSYDVNVVNNIAHNLNGKPVDENDGGVYWNNLWYGASVPMLGNNDLKMDPKFTNPFTGDLTPAAGSPAIGSGTTALAPNIDIAGNPRPPLTIDRGAIQVSH